MKIAKLALVTLTIFPAISVNYLSMSAASQKPSVTAKNNVLLSEPFLQLPTKNSVNVVWFTEFPGEQHYVKYGDELEKQVTATTTKLSRVKEDRDSYLEVFSDKSSRDIWRHEAVVEGLFSDRRLPYQVVSIRQQRSITSRVFSLASQPTPGTALKILLTSDHQLMPMTTANLEQVVKTIGRVDAVFLPGDLVNVPDRASEWFDDRRGGAFFSSLQGRGNYKLERSGVTTTYRGGEIIQHAPLFTAVGNHEVMGRVATNSTLKQEFNQPHPRQVATEFYQQNVNKINPTQDPQIKARWIKNHSFNTDTYKEIFTLPQSNTGKELYYATTFGDVRLISLYVTNIWRSPGLDPNTQGRYKESSENLNNPQSWACGDYDINDYVPKISKCRIYKPVWKVILEWFKTMSSAS